MSRPDRMGLVLAAHGSRHDPAVNEQISGYAATISARCGFSEAVAVFHQGQPCFAESLDRLTVDEIVIVPVMASDGYYCSTVLPSQLARNARWGRVRVHITDPVGTHPQIATLIARRLWFLLRGMKSNPELPMSLGESEYRTRGNARSAHEFSTRRGVDPGAVHLLEIEESFNEHDVTLALIGHGTQRHERSRLATIELVERLEKRRICNQVVAAFVDEEPSVESVAKRARHSIIVAIPHLIGGGYHAACDIPRRLGIAENEVAGQILPLFAWAGGKRIVCDRAIGMDEGVIDTIEDRAIQGADVLTSSTCDSAASDGHLSELGVSRSTINVHRSIPSRRSVLRLGTRGSAMAKWQAAHAADLLRNIGLEASIVEISTLGDRRRDMAIGDLPSDAPFTDDIDWELLSGRIDVAVHCLKDMPLVPVPGVDVAAMLPRQDAREALVGRAGMRLADLPIGARVGTCSIRRSMQLHLLRPDLRAETIRGPADDRVVQIQRGDFDAAVLALAGLERLSLIAQASEVFSIDRFMPAPGQGVLAICVRCEDTDLGKCLSALDHRATRIAATTERMLEATFDQDQTVALAAYAEAMDGIIKLRARLIARASSITCDVSVSGKDADMVALEAARLLRESPLNESRAECSS